MNTTTYVIRTFGGVLILVQNVPSTSILPTVTIALTFRNGVTQLTFRNPNTTELTFRG